MVSPRLRGSRCRKVPTGLFPSEVALCESLISAARAAGLRAHPEASGWDVLLADPATGEQVGVQAKLRPSVEVLGQAIRPYENGPGPELHAVLVPAATWEFRRVAQQLRLVVLQGGDIELDKGFDLRGALAAGRRWAHPERAWEPPFEVPGMVAGSSAPRTLSPWKIAAARLCSRLRKNGFVTAKDFAELRIDKRWWADSRLGCLVGFDLEDGTRAYEHRSSRMLPDERWPALVAALALEEASPEPARRSTRERRRAGPVGGG